MTEDGFLESLRDRFGDVLDKDVPPVTIDDVYRRAFAPGIQHQVSGRSQPKLRRRIVATLVLTFSLVVVGVALARVLVPSGLPASGVLLGASTGPCAGQPGGCGSPESSAAALARGSWSRFSSGPLSARSNPIEVWTGHELLIWGGATVVGSSQLRDGAAYDPATQQWRMLPLAPILLRYGAEAAWTGTEMIVLDGQDDAAAYDPATNSWRKIASFPLEARTGASTFWTGRQLIVIGGYGPSRGFSETGYEDGAAYTPATGRWEILPSLPATEGTLAGVVVAWTGTELIAWVTSSVKVACPGMATVAGGATVNLGPCTTTGQASFALDTGASSWDVLSKPAVQTQNAVIAWTGSSVLVMGGEFCPVTSCGIQSAAAASYDPATQTWTNVAYPYPMNGAWPGVWTGRVFIGPDPKQMTSFQIGAYDPTSHEWTVLPTPPHSVAYAFPQGVWTGRQLLFWGPTSEALTAGR